MPSCTVRLYFSIAFPVLGTSVERGSDDEVTLWLLARGTLIIQGSHPPS